MIISEVITLQNFTVLLTKIFRRCVIKSSLVNYLPTILPTEYVRRLFFYWWFHIPHEIICRQFYKRNLRAKKKRFPAWNIPTDFIQSVISCITDDQFPSVNLSVSVWNTDQIYPFVNSSVLVAATVKCRRINSVGKAVGDYMNYWPNVSVWKVVSDCGSYSQMPMDEFRQ